MHRPVREAVRIIDAMTSESHYSLNKCPHQHELIERESRNVISQGLIAAALKCASGFNMHGMRDCTINKNVIDSSCLRHSEIEDWDHVVKCRCAEGKTHAFLNKARKALEKADDASEDVEKINNIVNDISAHLKNETLFETNQEILGLANVFR